MATPPVQISYVNKSYEDERREILSRAPIVSKGVWTDLNNTELLVALVELMLGSSDMMRFYLDHQANEAYLQTARERNNVISLCNQLSHRMRSWTPSSGSVTVRLTSSINGYILIPKYTKFWSIEGLPYFSVKDVILSESTPIVDILLLQGLVQSKTYKSTGQPDQRFLIPSDKVGEGSITVEVDGKAWTEVDDHFVLSGISSEHYMLELGSDGHLHVVFGDGVFGLVPSEGSKIVIRWGDTQGPLGNVAENHIVRFDRTPENVEIQCSSSFSGGSTPESIAKAKKLAPMLLRSVWKAVTPDDFASLAENYPGVKQAKVLDINDFPLYSFRMSYHDVWVAVIPSDGGQLSDSTRADILEYLEKRKYVTCNLNIVNVEYVDVDIDVTVYKKSNYSSQYVESKVVDAINNLFVVATSPTAQYRLYGSVDGLVIGEDLRYSDLVTVINSVDGVAYIQLDSPTSDVLVNSQQIPRLGSLTLNVLDAVEVVQ